MNKSHIMEKTVAFYEKTFSESEIARRFLYSHQITQPSIFQKFRIGFSDGSILEALPKKGKIIEELQDLGVLIKDREFFNNCLTFPVIDKDHNIINIGGIDILTSEEKYLFEATNQLFNLPVINTYSEIYQSRNIMDLLSLETAGIFNTVAGTGDIPIKGINVIGIKDNLNDILIQDGASSIEALLAESSGENSIDKSESAEDIEQTKDGFKVQYALRKYEIIGLQKDKRKLKATVRIEKAGRIHVDTIDFYSSRMRRRLQQEICSSFDEFPANIELDLNKLLSICEKQNEKSHNKIIDTQRIVISPMEEKEARTFGESENIITEILNDYKKMGFVGEGENPNKLLCYLSATSRLMGEGNVLSVITLSSSGAGKSKLQDTTLNLMPPEDVIKLTNLSGKALFYKERSSLKNKILALEECKAVGPDADYAIRTLISSGQLISEVTVKDPSSGKMTTQQNVIDAGCTSVFFTSTNPNMNAETASRFFVIGINESPEQTKAILEHQMNQFSIKIMEVDTKTESVKNKHRTFQRLLKDYKVVNPFKITFNDTRLQARRLFPQILNLINTTCFLRQMQKEIKTHNKKQYIEVDKEDIKIALDLAANILSKSINELSIPSQDLLNQIDSYLERMKRKITKIHPDESVSKSNISFTRKELRSAIGWSNTRLHVYIKELQDHEYVLLVSGGKNTLQHYRLLYDADGKLTWFKKMESMIQVE